MTFTFNVKRTTNHTVYELLDEHGCVCVQVTALNWTKSFQPSEAQVQAAFALLIRPEDAIRIGSTG